MMTPAAANIIFFLEGRVHGLAFFRLCLSFCVSPHTNPSFSCDFKYLEVGIVSALLTLQKPNDKKSSEDTVNIKSFLSASLLSLSFLSCHNQEVLSQEESCPVEEPSVILPNIPSLLIKAEPASTPASEPVVAKVEPVIQKPTPTRDESEMRLVVTPNKKPMIALQITTDKNLAKGKAKWISKKDLHAVQREVNTASLPESTLAWVGQDVKLYKRDGSFCEAKVTGLSLLGELYVYEDSNFSAAETFKRSLERDGVRVVAELDIDSCEGAAFARLASLPEPSIIVPEKASKELRKLVLPQMRALSIYKETQKNYVSHLSESGEEIKQKRWENYYDATPIIMTVKTQERTIVFASAQQDGGCGDFYGNLFAMWELKSDGTLAFLYQGDDMLSPDFAFDVDGDNTLEFFQGESWQQLQNGKLQVMDLIDVPFEEDVCGC
jgi:hypothetical protein